MERLQGGRERRQGGIEGLREGRGKEQIYGLVEDKMRRVAGKKEEKKAENIRRFL